MARLRVLAAVTLALLAFDVPAARAGDVTIFVGQVSPTERWGNAYGASLSSTWFQVMNFEAEAARWPGEVPEEIMTTFTGSAFLAPTIGRLVPYGGIGIGFFRQSRMNQSDTGVARTFALGAKLKLGLVLLRAEWRRINLSGEPFIEIDSRVAAGVGINF